MIKNRIFSEHKESTDEKSFIERMTRDVPDQLERVVTTYPLAALGTAISLGVIFGWLTKRR